MGIGNLDPGAWWDPRNWSVGGQKILGGGNVPASTPRKAPDPFGTSTPRSTQGGMAPGLGKSTSEQTPQDAADARQQMIDDFYKRLSAPLDFNDPYVKNILDNARATTLQSANNAGIFGPYSQNQAEQAWIKGAAGLQSEKTNQALQALGMATGQFNNQRDFNYGAAKDKWQSDVNQWQWKQQNNPLGFLGGLAGAGIGGLIGGPGGATAGYGLGSGLGGYFGSQQVGGPPAFNPSGGGGGRQGGGY